MAHENPKINSNAPGFADMLIRFDNDLKLQEFFLHPGIVEHVSENCQDFLDRGISSDIMDIAPESLEGYHKAVAFKNPVLMLDPARVHKMASPGTGKLMLSLFGNVPTTAEYNGVRNTWDAKQFPGTWPVSIDTLHVARTIDANIDTANLENVLDLGCGTGFLGQYATAKPDSKAVCTYSDLNPHAVRATRFNVDLHGPRKQVDLVVGNSYEGISDAKKFDLIICNPPYIPKRPDDNSPTDPYRGTHLLETAIREARNRLTKNGRVILNHSRVATREFDDALAKSGGIVDSVSTKRVPFRVPPVLEDPQWLAMLEDRGLLHDDVGGYEYWHEIDCKVIRYPK